MRRERLYKIRGFVAGLTGPRKRAFNTWAGALVEAALKRRALASFTRQSEVRALNKWRQFADERRAQMQKMITENTSVPAGTMKAASPAGMRPSNCVPGP